MGHSVGEKFTVVPVSNTLPVGVAIDPVEIDPSVPGQLGIKITAAWSDSDPTADPNDFAAVIDGSLVLRNQGRDQLDKWLIEPFVPVRNGDVRVWSAKIRSEYFGYENGQHQLVVRWLMGPNNAYGGEATYLFTLQATPSPSTEIPAPSVVPDRIPLGMFSLSMREFTHYNESVQAIKDAGIDYLIVGAFRNPADSFGGYPSPEWYSQMMGVTYEQWEAFAAQEITEQLAFCRDNGFGAAIELDGMFRTDPERVWWRDSPWRDQAVARTRDLCMQFPEVSKFVRIIDEVDFTLGADPWVKGVDPAAFYSLWHAVADAPVLSWPGQYSPEVRATYDRPGIRDFNFRYWYEPGIETSVRVGVSGQYRSVAQVGWIFKVMHDNTSRDVALAAQADALLGEYIKNTPGMDFTPPPGGLDVFVEGGSRPQDVAATVWVPLLLGSRLLQAYKYDMGLDRERRLNSPLGNDLDNMGTRPGSAIFAALGHAYRSVKERESKLLTRSPLPFSIADAWATGGVSGLSVAVNLSPVARACPFVQKGKLLTATGVTEYRRGLVPEGGVVLSV